MKNDNLTLEELMYIQGEVNSKSKSVLGSYLLTFLLWPLGVNRAYLEKTKSAIFRIILTILTVINFFVIANSAIVSSPEEIAKALVSSTSLAMSFILLFSISIIMLLLELILIPRWVNDIDNKNEMVAIEKAKRARYLSEHLLKDAIEDYLLKEIKDNVAFEVNSNTKSMLSKFEEKIMNDDNIKHYINKITLNKESIDNNYINELIYNNIKSLDLHKESKENIKIEVSETSNSLNESLNKELLDKETMSEEYNDNNVKINTGRFNKKIKGSKKTKGENIIRDKIISKNEDIQLYEDELKKHIANSENNLSMSIEDIINYKGIKLE